MSETEINSCEEALRLLAAHLDDELPDHTDGEMKRHLERCRSCWSRAEFERHLKDKVATLRQEPVPPELSSRVQSLVREFTTLGGR
ncbi:MAG: anti-sigma factor family protein [bacterium]